MRLILADIDRTIMPFGDTVVPARVREAFRAAVEAGCAVGPCSGRGRDWISILFDGDEPCYQTNIATNGLQVSYGGELVLERHIPAELVARMAALTSEVPRAGLVWFDGAAPKVVVGDMEDLKVAFPRYGACGVYESLPGHDLVKANAFVAGDDAATRELAELLTREIPELDFDVPQRGFVNTMPAGWNKGAAVLWLADYLGVASQDVFVFGDAENDLSMLRAVENSVAVANAAPEAAAAARWHIGACEDFAVADAVEALASGDFPFTE